MHATYNKMTLPNGCWHLLCCAGDSARCNGQSSNRSTLGFCWIHLHCHQVNLNPWFYMHQTTPNGPYTVSSWLFLTLVSSQTGSIDRSQDIMMQIDHTRLRDCESLYKAEKMVRHHHPDQNFHYCICKVASLTSSSVSNFMCSIHKITPYF